MKVISLTQPWASLMLLPDPDGKRWETRWAKICGDYVGPLGIHAALRFPKEARAACFTAPFRDVLSRYGFLVGDEIRLDFGVILGRVDLVKSVRMSALLFPGDGFVDVCRRPHYGSKPGAYEWSFGHYSEERVALFTTNPLRLKQPIPARDALGAWDYPTTEIHGRL